MLWEVFDLTEEGSWLMVAPCVVPKHGMGRRPWGSCASREAGWAAKAVSRLHALFSFWVICYRGQTLGVKGWGGLHAGVGSMKAFSIFVSFSTLLLQCPTKVQLATTFPLHGGKWYSPSEIFCFPNTCGNAIVSGHLFCRSPWPELVGTCLWGGRLLGAVKGLARTCNYVNLFFVGTM